MSVAGGVSVSYVFVHVLPEIAEAQQILSEGSGFSWLSHHAYLMALVGLSVFYGLERVSRRAQRAPEDRRATAFWLHVGSFAVYNCLVGYLLLHREESGLLSFGYYAFAMGLHFVVTDHGLRQQHARRYEACGRWVLAGALVAGWALSVSVTVPESWLVLTFAFLSGGVILNVLKEELPEERQSRFWAFALGAGCYGLLLIAL